MNLNVEFLQRYSILLYFIIIIVHKLIIITSVIPEEGGLTRREAASQARSALDACDADALRKACVDAFSQKLSPPLALLVFRFLSPFELCQVMETCLYPQLYDINMMISWLIIDY